MSRHTHKNWRGEWCKCGFGRNAAVPVLLKHEQEHFGGLWKEASKLDWLRGNTTDDEQHRFLDSLEGHLPNGDILYPWLMREWKKGRLHWNSNQAYNPEHGPIEYPAFFHMGEPLRKEDMDLIKNWMKYKKQAKQGVDIMQHDMKHVMDEAEKWDGNGEVVHRFDAPETDYVPERYANWTVRRLRHKRDFVKEGERMEHCIGSNGMPYIGKNDRGEANYYSLRDERNRPHATLEMHYSGRPELGPADPHNPRYGNHSVAQFYGPNDDNPDPEHVELMNTWLHKHGHPHTEGDGSDHEEEFEPWWDQEYWVDGPEDAETYLDHHHNGYWEYAPEEYQRACSDADEHGHNQPDLHSHDPDWNAIVEDMAGSPDPDQIHGVFEAAKHEGDLDNLHNAYRDWRRFDYDNFLDPYGREKGPGYLHHPENSALAEPGSHFPSGYENDEYFVKNMEHHLAPYWNPQDGEHRLYRPHEEGQYGQSDLFLDANMPISERSQYYDHAKARLRSSELPPHLYPPTQFSHIEEPTKPLWQGQWSNFEGPTRDYNANEVPWVAKIAGPGSRFQQTQILETNSPAGYPMAEGMDWRVPVIYDREKNVAMFGQPGMEHHRLLQHFPEYAFEKPWSYGSKEPSRLTPGYVDTTQELHPDGGLYWFNQGHGIPDEKPLHDYVEKKWGVRSKSTVPSWMQAEDDAWTSE